MILLDTNIVSVLMKTRPEPAVLDWLDRQAGGEIFTSAITLAEIELGIALLPESKRRDALTSAAIAIFTEGFAGAILPFCKTSALDYANIVAHRICVGCPITTEDAKIATIALYHRFTLAANNIQYFEEISEFLLIDPW